MKTENFSIIICKDWFGNIVETSEFKVISKPIVKKNKKGKIIHVEYELEEINKD